MRDYGKIHTAYWTDDKIAALSVDGKLLGAYLLSCPHSNAIGCFRLPVGYISEDLRWSADTVHAALRELAAIGFICRDDASGWTLIRKFLEHNIIQNDNVGKACMKMVEAVPATFAFFPLLISGLEKNAERFPAGYLDGLRERVKRCRAAVPGGGSNGSGGGGGNGTGNGPDTVSKPFQNGSGTVPDSLREPFRIPEPLPEPETEGSVASATGAAEAASPGLSGGCKSAEAEPTPAALAWGPGLEALAQLCGRKPSGLRNIVGGWCRDYGEAAVVEAISAAVMRQPALVSPIPWIIEALKARKADGYGKRNHGSNHDELVRGLAIGLERRMAARAAGDGGGGAHAPGGYH